MNNSKLMTFFVFFFLSSQTSNVLDSSLTLKFFLEFLLIVLVWFINTALVLRALPSLLAEFLGKI